MKYIKYISILLLIVSSILLLVFYGSGYSDGSTTAVLNWGIVLTCFGIVTAVFFPLFFSNGKGKKGALVKIGFVAVLCVIAYLCSDATPAQGAMVEASESTWKYTDAGLILTSILFVIAVVAIVFGPVISKARNK